MQMPASHSAWELESLYRLILLPVYQAWPTLSWDLLPHFQHTKAYIDCGFESVISVIDPQIPMITNRICSFTIMLLCLCEKNSPLLDIKVWN